MSEENKKRTAVWLSPRVIRRMDSWLEEDDQPQETTNASVGTAYVINTNSGKFHLPTCSSVEDMSPSNRQDYVGDRQELLDQGYTPCGICKP